MPASFAPTFAKIKAAKSVPRTFPLPGGKAQMSRPASAHGFAFNSTFIMPGELTVTLIPLQLVPNKMRSGRLKNEKAKDNDRGGRNIGIFAR